MKKARTLKSARSTNNPPALPFGEKPDGNYMGRTCGYKVVGGKYYLASVLRDPINALGAEEAGVRRLLEIVTDHCSSLLSKVGARKEKWFTEIFEELEVPEAQRQRLLYFVDGYLELKPEQATSKASA